MSEKRKRNRIKKSYGNITGEMLLFSYSHVDGRLLDMSKDIDSGWSMSIYSDGCFEYISQSIRRSVYLSQCSCGRIRKLIKKIQPQLMRIPQYYEYGCGDDDVAIISIGIEEGLVRKFVSDGECFFWEVEAEKFTVDERYGWKLLHRLCRGIKQISDKELRAKGIFIGLEKMPYCVPGVLGIAAISVEKVLVAAIISVTKIYKKLVHKKSGYFKSGCI